MSTVLICANCKKRYYENEPHSCYETDNPKTTEAITVNRYKLLTKDGINYGPEFTTATISCSTAHYFSGTVRD